MSGNRCKSDCRSRGREFDPSPEIDHEIISMVILLPSAVSFKKGCCQFKRKYVHEVLVNCLFKLAQEKVWLGELTIAVDLGRKATKQTKFS